MTDALSAAIESILRTDDLSEEIHQAQINTLRDAYEAALAQPQEPVKEPHCEAHGECFGGECIYTAPPPVQDRLEQLRAFCKWERSNNPNPEGLPHVAEWAVMEIDRLRAAKAQPVKRSQDWHDGVIEGHLRERDYWLAKQAEPVQEPQRKPLSKAQIYKAFETALGKKLPNTLASRAELVAIARAVEQAHSIK